MVGTSFCLCQTHHDNDGSIANVIGDDSDADIGGDGDTVKDDDAPCESNNNSSTHLADDVAGDGGHLPVGEEGGGAAGAPLGAQLQLPLEGGSEDRYCHFAWCCMVRCDR